MNIFIMSLLILQIILRYNYTLTLRCSHYILQVCTLSAILWMMWCFAQPPSPPCDFVPVSWQFATNYNINLSLFIIFPPPAYKSVPPTHCVPFHSINTYQRDNKYILPISVEYRNLLLSYLPYLREPSEFFNIQLLPNYTFILLGYCDFLNPMLLILIISIILFH